MLVLCHGCFDILHFGHLSHLKAAHALGDELIVSITDDAHVNKGPGRPIFSAAQRAEMMRALSIVSSVIIVSSAEDAINRVWPNVYCKGKEYEGGLPEQRLVESHGGRVVFTDTPVYSSTALIPFLDFDRLRA